ncbi:MAG TPA: cytochrome c oxidase subunit 3 [Bryobacteraceae bacterium]|nr:cytochrome c oxidase subunit 3 [Bryobacteraceae bacterium]
MTAHEHLDVSGLPAYDISNQAPLWWGQLIMTAIEGTLFCILIATYFYLRLSVDIWPAAGARLPHLSLPTLALAPLILSAFGSYWATEAAKKNNRRGMILGMLLNLVLSAIFLAMRLFEWHSFNFNWASDAHGSIVWTILGLHTFDFVGGMIETLVLLIIILSGRYGEKQRQGVHVDSVVWYFVVGIWLPLYAVIYWGPQVVGTPL